MKDCERGSPRLSILSKLLRGVLAVALLVAMLGCEARAGEEPGDRRAESNGERLDKIPNLSFISGEEASRSQTATVVQIVFLITVLTLAPSILMLMTCFTRVVIVLSFLRRALATQQLPPNQIIVGLSLFLTFAIMAPVMQEANNAGLQPYLNKEISQKEALVRAAKPFRRFMLSHTRQKDLRLFVSLDKKLAEEARSAGGELKIEKIPTLTIVPAYVHREHVYEKKILIVDDELSVRGSLEEWFLEDGFEVETAEDGEAALLG